MTHSLVRRLYANYYVRRDKLQILADILTVTKKPMRITGILRLANIQYNMFDTLAKTLCQSGLLEKSEIENTTTSKNTRQKRYTFKATDQGLKWCESVYEIYDLLENVH